MGNCQAAEVAMVVIQHPGGNKVERIYWSVSANEIMNANPGHYVALVMAAPPVESGAVKQLKLLRPDDTLVLGQVYRLVSFEDVLKEFTAKKCVKSGKLLRERGALKRNSIQQSPSVKADANRHLAGGNTGISGGGGSSSRGGKGRSHTSGGQWRPALQSISELGS